MIERARALAGRGGRRAAGGRFLGIASAPGSGRSTAARLGIRVAAMSVATAFNRIANWAVSETLARMSDWNLPATYVVYAAVAVPSFGFIAGFVPETKRKEPEDMGRVSGIAVRGRTFD